MAFSSSSVYSNFGADIGTGPLCSRGAAWLFALKAGCPPATSPRYEGMRRANSRDILYPHLWTAMSSGLQVGKYVTSVHELREGRGADRQRENDLPVEISWVEVERGFDIVMRRDVQAADGCGMLKVPPDSVAFVHRHLRAVSQIPGQQETWVSMAYHGIRDSRSYNTTNPNHITGLSGAGT